VSTLANNDTPTTASITTTPSYSYGNTTTQSWDSSGGSTYQVPTTTAPPLDETTAAQQLSQLVSGDRPYIAANLADRWIPQLSSKRPGVVDDGQVFNNVLILQEHMRLRQQYNARLIWSGDWSTFDGNNWWITVVPVTFPSPGGALAWCRQNGLDRDHCYAKLVSTTHPPAGSTALN
jgi:serine/threonine-protein kinase